MSEQHIQSRFLYVQFGMEQSSRLFPMQRGKRTTHEKGAQGDFPDDDGIDHHALDPAEAEAEDPVQRRKGPSKVSASREARKRDPGPPREVLERRGEKPVSDDRCNTPTHKGHQTRQSHAPKEASPGLLPRSTLPDPTGRRAC